jgi:hypothetical protein
MKFITLNNIQFHSVPSKLTLMSFFIYSLGVEITILYDDIFNVALSNDTPNDTPSPCNNMPDQQLWNLNRHI